MRSRRGLEALRRSGSVRKAPPKVRGNPGGVEGVRSFPRSERPPRKFERGQEAHLKIREGSGGTFGVLGGVERPTRRFGRGREAFPQVRNGSGDPPRFGRGWQAPPSVWEGLGGQPKVWEGWKSSSKSSGRVGRQPQRC